MHCRITLCLPSKGSPVQCQVAGGDADQIESSASARARAAGTEGVVRWTRRS